MSKKKEIKIKQIKSGISCTQKQRANLTGLGFKRMGQIVVREDTPEVRGMINKINHLVQVVEG